jgi:protein EFR3
MDTDDDDDDEVPPVPPLPASYIGKTLELEAGADESEKFSSHDYAAKFSRRNMQSRDSANKATSGFADHNATNMGDLQSLLMNIDSKPKQHTIGNLTRPPY